MILPLLLLCLRGVCAVDTVAPAQIAPKDLSDFLGLLLAADFGGGLDSNSPHRATLSAGIKIGVPVGLKGGYPPAVLRTVTLDLDYDRTQAHDGFSGEISMMLPIARFPSPRTPDATYVRVYVEPGGGYRGGGGDFGSYASAKAMLALFSDNRLTLSNAPPSFFLEIQRRFPLTAPLHGDTRLAIGLMIAVCNHCGLN